MPLSEIRKLRSYRWLVLSTLLSLLLVLAAVLVFATGACLGIQFAVPAISCGIAGIAAYLVSLVFQAKLIPKLPRELVEPGELNTSSFLVRPPPAFEQMVRDDVLEFAARFR